MRKAFRTCCALLFVVSVIGLFGLAAYGQDKNHPSTQHRGSVQDWSERHVVYARVGPPRAILALRNEPRAIAGWDEAIRKEKRRHEHVNRGDHGDGDRGERGDDDRDEHGGGHHSGKGGMNVDWHISLGLGTTSAAMFPAKFSFDPNAAVVLANCTTDFIVFPVNAAGSGTQPNLVGLNNLYSGTAPGPVGLCNVAPSVVDDGVSATTLWSYNIQGISAGSSVSTSPTLSLDGNKVAFVETKAGNAAHFHVLAWRLGDGFDNTNAQNALLPVTISTFSGTAPVATLISGVATDLTLGSTAADTDTLSSPFVDYAQDVAYVGNDNGKLFRILNVFCMYPGCANAAPTLDASVGWGTAGKTVCVGKLTAPVQDGLTGNIFVGCADGKVYGFTPAGAAIPNASMIVGDGSATGGVVDPPMIDAVNGWVFAASGNSGGGTPTQVIVQAKTADFTSRVVATLGPGGLANLHDPDFNDNYFSQLTNTVGAPWLLYVPAVAVGGGADALYGITFGALHAMTAGTPANQKAIPLAVAEFSPATEFLTAGGEDRLFESALLNVLFNLASFNISTVFPPAGPPESFVSEGTGTSGIVVDNSSPANQANSLYFGSLGAAAPNPNSAVKVTQALFQ